ncbi:MAG: hypothetical protein JWR44_3366 [Hymenobacter sp.]|jgi:hypothetical protein|nr:hypothetical protein [Hymenobacter sp.]
MLKKTLLAFALTASAIPAFSQGRDTVFAIHKLFREKSGTSQSMLDSTSYSAIQARYQRNGRTPTAQDARQDALYNTAARIAGTLKDTRYSTEEEASIISRYRQGQALPPEVRRKLRRKHFHRTSGDVLEQR